MSRVAYARLRTSHVRWCWQLASTLSPTCANCLNAHTRKSAKLDRINRQIDQTDFMDDRGGTHTARSLAFRRWMVREDYSLDNLMRRAKIANDGQPVPEKTAGRLKELSETIKRTNEDLARQD